MYLFFIIIICCDEYRTNLSFENNTQADFKAYISFVYSLTPPNADFDYIRFLPILLAQ